MSDTDEILGVFPLGLVLLPGEHVPLHIFEPRYRALVADCTLGQRPFVVSLAAEEGVARVGCTATIDALIRRFADGRLNIVVRGGDRVELIQETAGDETYITARVSRTPDTVSVGDPATAASVQERFDRLSEEIAGAPHGLAQDVPLSYAVAGAIELDPANKQRLLETRDEQERLVMVGALLDTALSGLDRQEVAAERAKTNGKVTLQ